MEYYSWENQRDLLFKDGIGYLKTLEKHLIKPSRFDNKLLFNMAVMSYEKMFSALLAHFETEATHHTPLAMYKEASNIDLTLNEGIKETARFIQSFESICTFDDKGYTTPNNEELVKIINGLIDIRKHIEAIFSDIP